jgi:hypothetical protein
VETWEITTRDHAELAVVSTWNGDPHEFAGEGLFAWMGVEVAADELDTGTINASATKRRLTDAAAAELQLGETWNDPEDFFQVVAADHPAVDNSGDFAVFIRRVSTDA